MGDGLFRWNGSAFVAVLDADDIFFAEPGDITMSVKTSKAGWLAFNQVIANCNTAYPDLWAVAPSAWKSGTTLTLPDMTDRVGMGGGTLGATGGANSVTLATANLPSHSHSIDHDHGSSTTGAGDAHSHSISHTHTVTVGSDGSHAHEERYINTVSANAGTYSMMRPYGWSGTSQNGNTSPSSHSHSGNTGNPSSANSGSESTHTHAFDMPAYTGNSGNAGSGTAVTTTPAHVRVNFFIKY